MKKKKDEINLKMKKINIQWIKKVELHDQNFRTYLPTDDFNDIILSTWTL